MRKIGIIVITALALCGFSCSNLATNSRNTIAALQGAILAAQTQYKSQCTAAPTGTACVAINKAIDGENALVTATEAYCGWSTTSPPANPNAPCVPVTSATAALQSAIANATNFITELKGVIQ